MNDTRAPMIRADSLCRYYGTDRQISALDDVTFEIAAGERVCIVGRSGSGKTTLLNLLSGLDHPSNGELWIDGRNLAELSRRQMADYRLRSVGVIFQSFQLIAQRTALQNVELPLILAGIGIRERQIRANEWLERVGLAERADHFPWQLSGGEQQRVAIARALVHQPKVLLADEPTGNLDSHTAGQIVELVLRMCDQLGLTFVLVTHDAEIGRRCCERQCSMSDGLLTVDNLPTGEVAS